MTASSTPRGSTRFRPRPFGGSQASSRGRTLAHSSSDNRVIGGPRCSPLTCCVTTAPPPAGASSISLLATADTGGYTLVMCGRYTLTNPSDLAVRFGLGAITEPRLEPRFNIAPAQLVPIVVEGQEGRSLELMRWGFRPAWKDLRQPPPINARAETLFD